MLVMWLVLGPSLMVIPSCYMQKCLPFIMYCEVCGFLHVNEIVLSVKNNKAIYVIHFIGEIPLHITGYPFFVYTDGRGLGPFAGIFKNSDLHFHFQ